MDTYLFSIQPKWCEKIFNGEKTIEVRKTAPKPPFKVVVYCTKGNGFLTRYLGNGKVIGEFVCNEVDKYKYEKTKEGVGKFTISEKDFKDMAIDGFDLFDYADGKDIYGIHITDTILYDKPRELGEFRKPCGRGIEEAYRLASEDKELEKRDKETIDQECEEVVSKGFAEKEERAKEAHRLMVRDWLIANCTDRHGNLDLSGLDFRHFNGDIDISGMQVKGNLIQSYQHVYGDLIQCNQEVEGNLDQSCQMVEFDNSRASAAGNDIRRKQV